MPRYFGDAIPQPELPEPQIEESLPQGWIVLAPLKRRPSRSEVMRGSGRLAVTEGRRGLETVPDTVSIVGPNDFELTVTGELYSSMHGEFGEVRRQFQALTDQIMADPFGETCIDAFRDTDAGRWARVVHRITGPLTDLVPGKQLAIKGTGLDMQAARWQLETNGVHRSSLTDQFYTTLDATRRQQRNAPNGVGGLLFVNDVYGVVRWRRPDGAMQEWMLMENVVDGQPVENKWLLYSNGRGGEPSFSRDEHPELAELAMDEMGKPRFKWLARRLDAALGYEEGGPFGDLNGNNVLRQETAVGVRYVVIDVGSH